MAKIIDVMGAALRSRVLLLVAEDSADGQGGYVRDWVSAGQRWAYVVPQAGSEKSRRTTANHRLHVLIRNTPELPDGALCVQWRGEIYRCVQRYVLAERPLWQLICEKRQIVKISK